jgi:hypothetical protein
MEADEKQQTLRLRSVLDHTGEYHKWQLLLRGQEMCFKPPNPYLGG